MKKNRFIRCDEEFYLMIKQSGKPSRRFTKDVAELLKKLDDEPKRKKLQGWDFRI